MSLLLNPAMEHLGWIKEDYEIFSSSVFLMPIDDLPEIPLQKIEPVPGNNPPHMFFPPNYL